MCPSSHRSQDLDPGWLFWSLYSKPWLSVYYHFFRKVFFRLSLWEGILDMRTQVGGGGAFILRTKKTFLFTAFLISSREKAGSVEWEQKPPRGLRACWETQGYLNPAWCPSLVDSTPLLGSSPWRPQFPLSYRPIMVSMGSQGCIVSLAANQNNLTYSFPDFIWIMMFPRRKWTKSIKGRKRVFFALDDPHMV